MTDDKTPTPVSIVMATEAQRRVYELLAKEGGGTWATYMMMDIEAAFPALPVSSSGGIDLSAEEKQTLLAMRSGAARVVIVSLSSLEDAPRQKGEDLLETALAAVENYNDWASNNEAEWTGWGDQIVPPGAEYWRVKSDQALKALQDCAVLK